MKGTELNYPLIDRHCLTIIFATQKLLSRRNMSSAQFGDQVKPFKVYSIETNFVKTNYSMATLTERVRHKSHNLKGIKSQALSDLLAQYPTGKHEDSPCEEIDVVEEREWLRWLYDSSRWVRRGGGWGQEFYYKTMMVMPFIYPLSFYFPVRITSLNTRPLL